MIHFGKHIYSKELSTNSLPITTYRTHTFPNDVYYYDIDNMIIFQRYFKSINGEKYNFKQLKASVDGSGYPFVTLINNRNKYVHVYLRKLFKNEFNSDTYEVRC